MGARVGSRGVALGLGLISAVLAGGCTERSAEDDPGELEAYGPPAPRFEPFDYFACQQGAVVPTCSGAQCAQDDTEDLLALFEEAIEAYDVARWVDVSRTYFHLGQRQLRVEYQVHVGWARSGHVLSLREEATRDEMIAAVDGVFEALELPTFLADPDLVVEGLTDCIPQAQFDPCTAFESPAVARAMVVVTQGDTVDWLARIDTETGATLTCGAED